MDYQEEGEDGSRRSAVLVDRLAASLAHALANPLSLVKGRLELLRADASPEDFERVVAQLQGQIRAMIELLARVQDFARHLRPEPGWAELDEELAAAVATCATHAERGGVTLELRVRPVAKARVPRGWTSDVLAGLIAFAALRRSPARIACETSFPERGSLECLCLSLSFSSNVELATTRRALMDPWLDGPTDDACARLELALALGLVQNAGGWYERGGDEQGPVLTVYLPLRP